jgi:hypothetical protein
LFRGAQFSLTQTADAWEYVDVHLRETSNTVNPTAPGRYPAFWQAALVGKSAATIRDRAHRARIARQVRKQDGK